MIRPKPPSVAAHAARGALILALAGCASPSANTTLYSARQPVVERTVHALDVSAGAGGLAETERHRLDQWFAELGLGYGDRLSIADMQASAPLLAEVAAMAAGHGAVLVDAAPAANPPPDPGTVRITVSRSRAGVPGCPDWSRRTASNLGNATNPNFGCAVNGNLAAMVADPEDLLRGAQGSGETVAMTASKAIVSYREQEPTGAAGLPEISSRRIER